MCENFMVTKKRMPVGKVLICAKIQGLLSYRSQFVIVNAHYHVGQLVNLKIHKDLNPNCASGTRQCSWGLVLLSEHLENNHGGSRNAL